MSSITGGIFSRPKGTTGGLVFGAARSRIGKVVTIREKVDPTNPNTPAQQTQRTIFSQVLTIVRTLGASIYQTGWNRAIGQLPGFQSLMSVLMNQMTSIFDLVLTIAVNLGILHYPDSVTLDVSVANRLTVDWTDELGSNGTLADDVVILAIPKTRADRDNGEEIVGISTKTRADLTQTIDSLTTGVVYEVYFYLLGAGTATGLKSVANPLEATIS